MITQKDIILKFKEISKNHKQINDFGWGEIYNISTKNIKFPYLHILPISSKKNGSLQKLSMKLYILDLQNQDNKNLLDIMSNTFEIGNDVVTAFIDFSYTNEFDIDENNIVSYFITGEFDDYTSGFEWNINITYKQYNNCDNIPYKNN